MTKFQEKLKQLEDLSRLRNLSLPRGIDLTSNDYLGMCAHQKLRAAAREAIESGIDLGAGGSRLLRGHTSYHEVLEDFAARYFGAEKALYFATGFQANYALFTTLPDRHDTIIFDELIHASVRDGILSSHAESIKVKHNDLQAYEDAIRKARQKTGQIWVAVESLYSMDGDFAPLSALYNLARTYDAFLIVDEAHATGVWGKDGKGFCKDIAGEHLIVLHTCGKAIGVAGGLVCAQENIIDYLINKARPFIYSTAPMPLQALLVKKSLEILQEEPQRREDLHRLIAHAKTKGFAAQSQIFPIILGSDAAAIEIAEKLQAEGFDIRAIRPPTVPEGTSRLRLSLSAHIDEKILDDFAAHLEPLLENREAA